LPQNGKLHFETDYDAPTTSDKSKKFKFVIHNEYQTTDKLVWNFEEISEDKCTITIKIQKYHYDNFQFYIRINHPCTSTIVADNKSSITDEIEGKLNFLEGKAGYHHCTIIINKKILTYQGFELSWIKNG